MIEVNIGIKEKEAIIDFTRDTIFWISKKYIELEKEMGMEKGMCLYKESNIVEFLQEYKAILDSYSELIDDQRHRFINLHKLKRGNKND